MVSHQVRKNVIEWAETTSFHGPGDFIAKKHWLWRLFWGIATIVMVVLAVLLMHTLFSDYVNGKAITESIQSTALADVDRSKHFDTVLYCSDDWVNVTKVYLENINKRMLLFAISLIQSVSINSTEKIGGIIGDLIARQRLCGDRLNCGPLDVREFDMHRQFTDFNLVLDEDEKPYSLSDFENMLLEMNTTFEEFIFNITNRFDHVPTDVASQATTVACKRFAARKARLKHMGFMIRNARVCQRLSTVDFIDEIYLERKSPYFYSKRSALTFCIYHNRSNMLIPATRRLSWADSCRHCLNSTFSFYDGEISGVDDMQSEIETVETFQTISDVYVASSYAINLNIYDYSEKPGHSCRPSRLGERFPNFIDFNRYCKSMCAVKSFAKNEICALANDTSVEYCQKCMYYYSSEAPDYARLPCQKYFLPEDVTPLLKLDRTIFDHCMERCQEPCEKYDYVYSLSRYGHNETAKQKFSCAGMLPADSYWTSLDACLSNQFSNPHLMFQDQITLKIPESFTTNKFKSLYSFEEFTSQVGGIMGLFIGASWMTFIHLAVYLCCCQCCCVSHASNTKERPHHPPSAVMEIGTILPV